MKIFLLDWGMLALLTTVVASFASTASPAQPENCVAGWANARGEPQTTRVVLDLSSGNRLDRASFPQEAASIACPRESIIPTADDVRVLIELRLSLGIVPEDPRSLWIWSQNGRLRITVDGGELSPTEAATVNDWLVAAQPRFDAAYTSR